MDFIPIEELLPSCNMSIYKLTRVASQRAIALASGKPALIRHSIIEKPTTVALKEIARGKVATANSTAQNKK